MSKKTYTLGPIQQLVDLSGTFVNFEAEFHAKTQDGSPFFFTVTTQERLDNGDDLQFHKAEGEIRDKITVNGNGGQHVWLVLKSDTESMCDIVVNTSEIKESNPPPPPLPPPQNQQLQPIQHMQTQSNGSQLQRPHVKSKFSVNWMLIGVIVVMALIGLYLFFGRSNNKDSMLALPVSTSCSSNTVASSDGVSSPAPAPSPAPALSLMDRLNNISVDAL